MEGRLPWAELRRPGSLRRRTPQRRCRQECWRLPSGSSDPTSDQNYKTRERREVIPQLFLSINGTVVLETDLPLLPSLYFPPQ